MTVFNKINYDLATELQNATILDNANQGFRTEKAKGLIEDIGVIKNYTQIYRDDECCDELKKENARLKNLLKEVRGKLKYINTPKNQHNIFGNDLMKKIDQVLGEE